MRSVVAGSAVRAVGEEEEGAERLLGELTELELGAVVGARRGKWHHLDPALSSGEDVGGVPVRGLDILLLEVARGVGDEQHQLDTARVLAPGRAADRGVQGLVERLGQVPSAIRCGLGQLVAEGLEIREVVGTDHVRVAMVAVDGQCVPHRRVRRERVDPVGDLGQGRVEPLDLVAHRAGRVEDDVEVDDQVLRRRARGVQGDGRRAVGLEGTGRFNIAVRRGDGVTGTCVEEEGSSVDMAPCAHAADAHLRSQQR